MAKAQRIVKAVETAQREPESRNDRFRRLANHRTKQVVERLRLLARLGSDDYERRPEQVKVISDLLEAELKATLDALRRGQERPQVEDII